MQRQRRLTGSKRFSLVRQARQSCANRLLVLRSIPNDLDVSRFGFLVGKRTGGAVLRNLVRRRLREAVRPMPVKPGWDIVLIARRSAAGAAYIDLKGAAQELLSRARLMTRPPAGEAVQPAEESRPAKVIVAERPRAAEQEEGVASTSSGYGDRR